jgi:hypothetical protein
LDLLEAVRREGGEEREEGMVRWRGKEGTREKGRKEGRVKRGRNRSEVEEEKAKRIRIGCIAVS